MEELNLSYEDYFAKDKIGEQLCDSIKGKIAIICIGTDRCIVDSLGPLVGTMLSKHSINADLYGTLNNPVHAMNVEKYANVIEKKKYDIVIAIDACVSNKYPIGTISVKEASIKPGNGIGKVLPEVGDISIVGIMDRADTGFHDLVSNINLSLVYDMAEIISNGIIKSFEMNSMFKVLLEG